MNEELSARIGRMKRVYGVCTVTSLALGLWTLVHPSSFWGTIGISAADPIVQAIYGGAICGEGIICGLGIRRPLRYLVIFQYMMAYKAVVCVGLVPRLLLMDDAPIAGFVIVACWAIAAVQAALVYPWGRWPEVVAAMRSE
jgi:hypothetical protein